MSPHVRRAVAAALLVLVALPGVRTVVEGSEAPDGFPLSTYPMFTRDRGRIVEVPAVVVVADGQVARLSPATIADTDQVIEAHNVVARAIRGGTADALCTEVATRHGVVPGETIEVVVERYDAVEWASGHDEPETRRVVASC